MIPIVQSWHSIKTKITFGTLAIFLISIWSLMFYASWVLHNDMERLLGEQQFSTVSIVAAEINQAIDDRLRAVETVAESITPAILGNTEMLQKLLEQSLVFQQQFNGGIFTTRLDGTATASIPLSAERSGVNYMERDHVAAALKEGKTTISKPVIGKKLRDPVVSMAAPIRDAQGKVIGALIGVTDLSKPNFLDKISGNSYGKTGGYLIVAREHRLIITATDKKRIMEELPAVGVNPYVDRNIAGYEGYSVVVNALGVENMGAVRKIPASGWSLMLVMPTAEAFAPIVVMRQRILIGTMILTLLAGGLTWWMLKRQLSPMLTAMRTLVNLSDTNQHPQPLPITSQDEIGDLIGGFNRLLETLRQRDEQVSKLAFYDTLTQLPNRRLLNDRLGQAIAANKRSGYYGAVLFLDLDNFKSLNDTHGHSVGDLLLIQAADRLKSCLREMDTAARFGGDEFVVLINELDVDESQSTKQAGIIADKIHAALAKPYVLKIQHDGTLETTVEHICTASIGVALFGKHNTNLEDILKWADTAMYQAKETGRNLISFYDSQS